MDNVMGIITTEMTLSMMIMILTTSMKKMMILRRHDSMQSDLYFLGSSRATFLWTGVSRPLCHSSASLLDEAGHAVVRD